MPSAVSPETQSPTPERSRTAFTLIEVIIALSLVIAMSVIVLPSVLSMLDERAFESAGDLVVSQMLLSRAAAQESGRPVEVVYRPEPRVVQARWFDPDERLLDMATDDARAPLEAGVQDDGSVIAEPWATRVLSGTVRITGRSPAPDDGAFDRELDLDETPFGDAPDELTPLRLAVYLPDGSTLIRRDVWLVDDEGRAAALRVNRFTGRPEIERLLDEPTEEPEEPVEDEPAADESEDDRPERPRDRAAPAERKSSSGEEADASPDGEPGETGEPDEPDDPEGPS